MDFIKKLREDKRRIKYLAAFLLLLITEVLIALFVHDSFIRPYIGDMIVVIVIYCFIRIFIVEKCKLLPFYIFIFAAGVELMQYMGIANLPCIAGNTFLKVLIGSVFDYKDILCYGAGCILLGIYEFCKGR